MVSNDFSLFSFLGKVATQNPTTRYSTRARQVKPDWQKAYESAGYATNSRGGAAARAGASTLALLKSAKGGTNQVILQEVSNSLLRNKQLYEQIALQTRISQLGDPIERLRKENPNYRPLKKDPIPDLTSRARDFIRKLKSNLTPTKDIGNPFPKASRRVSEDRVFGDQFKEIVKDYDLTQRFPLRVSINRESSFELQKALPQASPSIPTHVLVKLHSGKSDVAFDQQKDAIGKLEIYDSATDTVVRTVPSAGEIITFAEFQQLRYNSPREEVSNRLDYLDFITLNDADGNGSFDDAVDRRGGYEQISFGINGDGRNAEINGQQQWKENYLNVKNSRFNTAIIHFEGNFVGGDALTDYQNGDIKIEVNEAGYDKNVAKIDLAASSGNKLVFKFDYAYDGISLTAKYKDNEAVNTGIEKVAVTLD